MIDGEKSKNKTTIGYVGRNEDSGGMTFTKDQYHNLVALHEKRNLEAKCSSNVVKGSSSFAQNGGNT